MLHCSKSLRRTIAREGGGTSAAQCRTAGAPDIVQSTRRDTSPTVPCRKAGRLVWAPPPNASRILLQTRLQPYCIANTTPDPLMETASLPSSRVDAELRRAAESALRDGESVSGVLADAVQHGYRAAALA